MKTRKLVVVLLVEFHDKMEQHHPLHHLHPFPYNRHHHHHVVRQHPQLVEIPLGSNCPNEYQRQVRVLAVVAEVEMTGDSVVVHSDRNKLWLA